MIKKIISVLFLFLFKCDTFAVTSVQAYNIFNNLKSVTKIKVNDLHIVNIGKFNAWSNVYGIYIDVSMLRFIKTNAELAGVLGHELTHWTHGDFYGTQSAYKELRADKGGLLMAMKLGYSKSSVLQFMVNMKKFEGDEGDNVHPSWSYRYCKANGTC